MAELLLNPVEVEGVSDEFVVNFTEELVVFQVAEPLNPPRVLLRAAVLGLARHIEDL